MTNGSEHLPEHPTGTDYKALLAEGREMAGEWGPLLRRVRAAEAERDALQAKVAAVREALTKDRVIMVTRFNGYTREDYSNPLVPVKAVEAALAEGDNTNELPR